MYTMSRYTSSDGSQYDRENRLLAEARARYPHHKSRLDSTIHELYVTTRHGTDIINHTALHDKCNGSDICDCSVSMLRAIPGYVLRMMPYA